MRSWISAAFLSRDGHLRNGWWIAAFLGLLAALLFPAILISAQRGHEITMLEQAGLIAVATLAIQFIRRKSPWEVTGRPGGRWLIEMGLGAGLGALLMAVPALFLTLGWIQWSVAPIHPSALWSGVLLMLGVAVAEELLFRGLLFQRLIDGLGLWPAQVIVGLFFVLTHMGNPNMEGATRLWAGANIFLASIVFGLAYFRTRSLALPIGLHFMANVTQGVVLGFGVSGASEPSLLIPRFTTDQTWLTGGAFGLEASLPGLVAVVALLAALLVWKRSPRSSAGQSG